MPQETFDLIERLRDRYPGLNLELLSPNPVHLQRMVARKGPNLFYESVENRLLCCNVRKVQPLTRHLATLDAWITGLRRDQWATRTNIRKVEIDHDHGAIVKLNPLAEWTEDEVWDYVRERELPVQRRSTTRATRRSAARRARAPSRPGEPSRAGPLVVGDERAEGVRDPLRDRDGRLRARAARAARRRTSMSSAPAPGRGGRGRARRGAGRARDGAGRGAPRRGSPT